MAKPAHREVPERVPPRLYLVTPRLGEPGALAGRLGDAVKATDAAAVLVRLAAGDERALINRIKALAPIVQESGAALLLDGHAELVARSGADGAHLANIEVFQAVLPILKPQRIAGCAGLETRHDAMLAAEEGADYVMFGEPNAGGLRPATEAVLERVGWWAEVFEIPCIACAGDLDEVGAFVQAGADFIAVDETIWGDADKLAQAVQRLAVAEPVS